MKLITKFVFVFLLVFSLTACNTFIPATLTALPTVVLGDAPKPGVGSPGGASALGSIVASGVVAPAQQAHLAFALSGVSEVLAAQGDRVEAEQPLLRLQGQESLEAAISAAEFELAQSEQALKDLTTAAETARVQAMQEIVTYAQAVKDAQYILDNFTIPSNQVGMDAVAALKLMQERLDAARAAFEPYKNRPSGDPTRRDLRDALDEAQSDYNAAVKRLQYEYNLSVAKTQRQQAQRDYDMYSAGPDPDKVRLAEARRANAQKQLAAAQAALERLTLKAPFAGTIAVLNVHSGEWVVAGQPLLSLADLEHLRIETTDLSERDVPQVQIGQAVTVFVKALGQEVAGRVAAIAPLADTLGGDVVYKITIDLDTIPEGLRAGMSVEVRFAP